jgi:hypothetical protein
MTKKLRNMKKQILSDVKTTRPSVISSGPKHTGTDNDTIDRDEDLDEDEEPLPDEIAFPEEDDEEGEEDDEDDEPPTLFLNHPYDRR